MSEKYTNKLTIYALLLLIFGMVLIFIPPSNYEFATQLSNIGLSLIIAAVVSLILDRITFNSLVEKMEEPLIEVFGERKIHDFGVSGVVPRFPFEELYSLLPSSKNFHLVQTWSPHMSTLLGYAEKMIENGGNIRVCLLHPKSKYAEQRSYDLNNEITYVPGQIDGDIIHFRSFYRRMKEKHQISKEEMQKRIQLKLYATLPTCGIYKVDKKVWVGFYWHGDHADNSIIHGGQVANQEQIFSIMDLTQIMLVDLTQIMLKIKKNWLIVNYLMCRIIISRSF